MDDFFSTLKGKLGPLPIYVWALLGTAGLALFLINRKNKAAATDSTTAAADQSNSDLGSAAELANFFNVAGLMPYQGGDVYVNTTQTNNPPPDNTTTPPPVDSHPTPPGQVIPPPKVTAPSTKPRAIYRVKPGENLTEIAKKYGISEAELWKYNIDPKVRTASAIKTLKSRGQNLIYSNEAIYIPPSTYK
jgi:LysM repeat protein